MPERVAIVGSGLAALAAYATLRHRGVPIGDITVFGTHADPTEVWHGRAKAIRQSRMRSESEGHLAAASWPGLALRDRDPRAWLATTANRYHPPVDLFIRHAQRVTARSGWEQSFCAQRVERIAAVDGGFELDGEGPFRHVLVATGHPGLARPVPGSVHAYEPHEYAKQVTIVGAGMAAAHEWLNALAAGSEVVSVRRREPTRRPLNVPRPLLTKRGLDAYHASSAEEHAATLRTLSQPSYPPGVKWDEPLRAAEREGRFRVASEVNGAEQVICATGFLEGFAHDPLLARLVQEHELPTHDRWIVLASDSTVAALTNGRTLSVAGIAGQWAFPAADTIAGAKYAARAFTRRVCRTR
ncbi:MAG TPA: FAD-dependent oxidoreductase [Gaiellaceae bacterium]|nr:FAD-dependent oxidoreductase [Gaiellaceae bacterium]